MDDKQITLEIEDTSVKCSKKLLSSHSDYFRVMFESDFAERNKSVIKLHDIDLKSMNLILQLLWDDTIMVEDEDILLVLHTACILQFNHIKYICVERITEKLNHENCMKIWLSTEQLDIVPLYLKAKNLALMEFNLIKDMDCILDLNLTQLKSYLANIYLRCYNEMDVFMTGIRWYYENGPKTEDNYQIAKENDMLFDILTCISFKPLTDSDVHEILSYPDVSNNSYVVDVLNCLLDIRHSKEINYNSDVVRKAHVFHNTKRRYQPKLLCVFINNDEDETTIQHMRLYTSDKYRRKRVCLYFAGMPTEFCCSSSSTKHLNVKSKTIMYFDDAKERLMKFFDIPEDKCSNLIGYSIIAYKELIFLLGGEMSIGRGKWNYNVWAYDTIRERWERKTKLPCGRRHFECCIANDILFIIGGTGNFRVLQENMLYYSYKEDKWSKEIMLPCRGLQVKCCEFKNQLFLLSINEKLAYVYNMKLFQWVTFKIPENALNSIIAEKFSLFSYDDKIYIKGSTLVQMNCIGSNMNVVSIKNLNPINCDNMQSVLCNNILYTLYTNIMDDDQEETYSLEIFNMDSLECSFLFENMSANETLEIDGSCYKYHTITKLLAFQHYNLLVNDVFV